MGCVDGGDGRGVASKTLTNAALTHWESKRLLKAELKSQVRRDEGEAEGGEKEGDGRESHRYLKSELLHENKQKQTCLCPDITTAIMEDIAGFTSFNLQDIILLLR